MCVFASPRPPLFLSLKVKGHKIMDDMDMGDWLTMDRFQCADGGDSLMTAYDSDILGGRGFSLSLDESGVVAAAADGDSSWTSDLLLQPAQQEAISPVGHDEETVSPTSSPDRVMATTSSTESPCNGKMYEAVPFGRIDVSRAAVTPDGDDDDMVCFEIDVPLFRVMELPVELETAIVVLLQLQAQMTAMHCPRVTVLECPTIAWEWALGQYDIDARATVYRCVDRYFHIVHQYAKSRGISSVTRFLLRRPMVDPLTPLLLNSFIVFFRPSL